MLRFSELVHESMKNTHNYKQEFIDKLFEIDDLKKLELFLDTILTDKEFDDIVKRLQIIKLLKDGHSQRDIVAKLGVGMATVTRGSKALKEGKLNNI